MDYTKQVGIGFNWVVRLDGQTVQEAIATLQALPQDAVLECHRGHYDIEADVMQTVPMTNEEILQQEATNWERLQVHWSKVIANHQRLYDRAVKEQCDVSINSRKDALERMVTKWEAIRQKYGK